MPDGRNLDPLAPDHTRFFFLKAGNSNYAF